MFLEGLSRNPTISSSASPKPKEANSSSWSLPAHRARPSSVFQGGSCMFCTGASAMKNSGKWFWLMLIDLLWAALMMLALEQASTKGIQHLPLDKFLSEWLSKDNFLPESQKVDSSERKADQGAVRVAVYAELHPVDHHGVDANSSLFRRPHGTTCLKPIG